MYNYEDALLAQGFENIAGCDEVGRGPLAGPLVVAAVILDPKKKIVGLSDSKKLSAKKRHQLSNEIYKHAKNVACAIISVDEVDTLNVYQASKTGMYRAIEKLENADYVLSDAMVLDALSLPHQALIKGDNLSASIAAASIIAKVKRDALMVELAEKYPNYGFAKHKGYPTKQHLKALREHGVSAVHRKSFKPVKKLIETQMKLDV